MLLSDLRLQKYDFEKIKSVFGKQKMFFEKIKNINNNLMQTLENDIQIKERIINNYEKNIYNYNSYLNLKNLYLNNNQKYESILENILINDNPIENNENKQINSSDYINNYLSILYYSLMLNNEETMNNSILIELNKKINNLNAWNINSNNKMKKEDQLNEGKGNNKNNDSFKQDSNFSIFNSKTFFNSQISPDFDNNLLQINPLPELKANNKFDNINTNNENKNNIKYLNMDIRKIFSYENNSQNSNNVNNNISQISDKCISKTRSENKIENIIFKDLKSPKNNKTKNKEENEDIDNNHKNEENYNINEEINNKNDTIKIYSINNMILLKSGNIAISKKEVIEIYDLRKLNFSGANSVYNNETIQKNCHIQTIKIDKRRIVNYVYELFDQTLLCATTSKIYRIRLTNNDSNYEIFGFIKIEKECPTKLITLGKEFLVVLTGITKFCYIKIFKIIEENKNQIIIPSLIENEENAYLSSNKDIKEDPAFKLIKKNVNEKRKLFLSIYPIIKNNNSRENKYEIRGNNYLYEFIATSNDHFNYTGKNHAVFFGIRKNDIDEYYVDKSKEIEGLSCSIEADSICQINDKYLCIGLQKQDVKKNISGFAFIDIYKREITRFINTNSEQISCICYNPINQLLFAAIEIKIEYKRSSFMTKIYKLREKKGDKGNKEIDLKEIYRYNNNHYYSIDSIVQMTVPHFNKENGKAQERIIFVTSSKDSTLEAIEVEIK